MEGCELDFSGMRQGLVEGVYEHGKEITFIIRLMHSIIQNLEVKIYVV
jgi:hypothetical protein